MSTLSAPSVLWIAKEKPVKAKDPPLDPFPMVFPILHGPTLFGSSRSFLFDAAAEAVEPWEGSSLS